MTDKKRIEKNNQRVKKKTGPKRPGFRKGLINMKESNIYYIKKSGKSKSQKKPPGFLHPAGSPKKSRMVSLT